MPQSEKFEVLVLGSGTGGKLIAWHMAQSGRRTAVVERRWVGGSCPNIACMPSKNEISSAKVAHVARHGGHYGTVTSSVTVDMATVRRRKREMVERQVAKHLQIYRVQRAARARGERKPTENGGLRHDMGGVYGNPRRLRTPSATSPRDSGHSPPCHQSARAAAPRKCAASATGRSCSILPSAMSPSIF